ncbi:MAG: C69 family dipeptidase [Bacteroidota bacterium]
MKYWIRVFSLAWIICVLIPFFLAAQRQECYLLMAGKGATVNGQVYLAHNNDLTGQEASMLVRVPGSQVMDELPGFSWPAGFGYEVLVLQIYKGFAEGDAVAINEHGVAIAGGLALGEDRNKKAEQADPLVETGLGGGVRYYALHHSRTARECITLIGELYNRYGVKYPSGVGVADTNEIWYMEAGGGRSWAAVRVPDSCYFIAANSYRIGEINVDDSLNYLTSPGLQTFCKEQGLWDSEQGTFHFATIFGGGRKEQHSDNYYNTRRVWRGIDLLNPELMLPSDSELFPMFLMPARKIDLRQCFTILRDHYEETPYDPMLRENSKNPERAIASWNCVHTDVITLAPGEPVSFGAVLWTGLSTPYAAIYVPVYFGAHTIPEGYDNAPSDFDEHAAFWQFKTLSDSLKYGFPNMYKRWSVQRDLFEDQEISLQQTIVKSAREIYLNHPEELESYLGKITAGFAGSVSTLLIEFLNDELGREGQPDR